MLERFASGLVLGDALHEMQQSVVGDVFGPRLRSRHRLGEEPAEGNGKPFQYSFLLIYLLFSLIRVPVKALVLEISHCN